MDSSMLTLLPKGIVTNTADIYDEVASYTVVPPNKVYEYWHVYTTTNKKLKDPTARRLENFWWHVWGSDRRTLSGRALARIFEDISVGPTVVPLRGPSNRWEGSDTPPLTVEMILAHLRAEALPSPKQLIAAATREGNIGGYSPTVSSSSSRQTQPHPILKKPNREMSSARRQYTARIVSPQESADEGGYEIPIPPSQDMRPKGAQGGFASSCEGGTLSHLESQSKYFPTNTVQAPATALSAKPAAANHHHSLAMSNRFSATPNGQQSNGDIGNRSAGLNNTKHTVMQPETLIGKTYARSVVAAPLSAQPESATEDGQNKLSARASGRNSNRYLPQQAMLSPAQHQQLQVHEGSAAMRPKRGLFTEATASTTKVAAQGTIIDQSGSLNALSNDTIQGSLPSRQPSALRSSESPGPPQSRLMPTQPSSATSLPLGRTKSQLTLLLERERQRSRDGSRS